MKETPGLNFNKELRPAFKNLLGKCNLIGAEIGVYRGNNAYNFLRDLDILHLYLIDPYIDHEDYHEAIHTNAVLEVKGQQPVALLDQHKDKITCIR